MKRYRNAVYNNGNFGVIIIYCIYCQCWEKKSLEAEKIFLARYDEWLMSCFRWNCELYMPRSHALPVSIQVPTTLGFLVTGWFQRELPDRLGLSQLINCYKGMIGWYMQSHHNKLNLWLDQPQVFSGTQPKWLPNWKLMSFCVYITKYNSSFV